MPKFPLCNFEEYIKPEDCSPLKIKAYRMDGKGQSRGMSAQLGLGSIPLCDYWYIDQSGKNILIEDTNLGKKIKQTYPSLEELKLMKEIEYHINQLWNRKKDKTIEKIKNQNLNPEKIIENIYKDITKRNYLKIYGSLLLISIIIQKYDDIKGKKNIENFEFLFVINDSEELRAIDHLESDIDDKIEGKIKGTLGGAKLLKSVKLVLAEALEEELRVA